jgi:hypothetical protein
MRGGSPRNLLKQRTKLTFVVHHNLNIYAIFQLQLVPEMWVSVHLRHSLCLTRGQVKQ